MNVDEPQTLILKLKGIKDVTASDIKINSNIIILNPSETIATITDKHAELDIEIKVERGLGYSAVESRKEEEKLAIGTIAIDAFFSPVSNVSYSIEDMRVGDRTNYNRLRLEIETDGTISPSSALRKASNILNDHFKTISEVAVQEFELLSFPKVGTKAEKEEKTKSKKKASGKKSE